MRGYLRFLALVTAALFLYVTGASADNRGLTIKLKASEAKGAPVTEEVRLYKSSHALVIGIDNYTGGWPRLSNAVKDAELVAEELRRKGFEVTLKTDLSSAELERAFKEFFILKGADADARLFVWFAGHGHTLGGEGYLVPADAPRPDQATQFKFKALNMRRFGELVREADSKHAFAVFDACFSGTIFTTQRALPPAAVTRATTLPVRQFLTSGDAGQTVSDDGTFRKLFVRALRGEERVDANGDGYVTATEMGLFLTDRVTNLTRARQTPRYGKLRDPDYDRGDFVFALAAPVVASRPVGPPPGVGDKETVFWQSIQSSANVADFQAYLEQYPNGTFAMLARNRLAALTPEIPTGPSPDTIREAQRLLKNLGYDPGTADGRIGSNTRSAIESFQRSHDLTVDGTVTDALLASLKVARKQVAAVRPAPAPAPAPSPAKPAVGVYPKAYKPGDVFKDCPKCPEMVVIPAGSFRMGDLQGGGDNNEKPVHTVTIPRAFAVGRYEVTRGEFAAFVNESGYSAGGGCYTYTGSKWEKSGSKNWRSPGFRQTDRDPVVCVNWGDAKAYVGWLSRKAGKDYRLPSEAEWEYMARAGSTAKYGFGDAESSLCAYGNAADRDTSFSWKNKSCSDGYGERTAPAGSFKPNAFGVYDTIGNVWEWVEDCWHGSYQGAPSDGSAWTTGGQCGRRVLRGGSWVDVPWLARTALRNWVSTVDRGYDYGFRVARTF